MPAIARMRAVVLDCPDPRALAEFHRALAGGELTYGDDVWVNLRDGGNVLLGPRATRRPPGPARSTASSVTSM